MNQYTSEHFHNVETLYLLLRSVRALQQKLRSILCVQINEFYRVTEVLLLVFRRIFGSKNIVWCQSKYVCIDNCNHISQKGILTGHSQIQQHQCPSNRFLLMHCFISRNFANSHGNIITYPLMQIFRSVNFVSTMPHLLGPID